MLKAASLRNTPWGCRRGRRLERRGLPNSSGMGGQGPNPRPLFCLDIAPRSTDNSLGYWGQPPYQFFPCYPIERRRWCSCVIVVNPAP